MVNSPLHHLHTDARACWHAAVAAVQPEVLVKQHLEVATAANTTSSAVDLRVRISRSDDDDRASAAGTWRRFRLRRTNAATSDDVRAAATDDDDVLTIDTLLVIGAGKAAVRMARAAHEVLAAAAPLITAGLVITKHGHADAAAVAALAPTIRVFEAGHPLPTAEGLHATAALIDLVRRYDSPRTLILNLLSGGASALLEQPVDGVSLNDLVTLTDTLLRVGADIQEMNTLRKHVSRVKGGRLAQLATSSHFISLVLSDVIGDPLDVIASGPTVPDPTTFADCMRIVQRYNLAPPDLPASILAHYERGLTSSSSSSSSSTERELALETPKRVDASRIVNVVIGCNGVALHAAQREATARHYHACIVSDRVSGDVREVAQMYTSLAREMRSRFAAQRARPRRNDDGVDDGGVVDDGDEVQADVQELGTRRCDVPLRLPRPLPDRLMFVVGGETTVCLTDCETSELGRGGRNQELAMRVAQSLDEVFAEDIEGASARASVVFLSGGTDGGDGPANDAAGGIVDHTTWSRARAQETSCASALRTHDSYAWLSELDRRGREGKGSAVDPPPPLAHLKTGPTGTNVMDVALLLIVAHADDRDESAGSAATVSVVGAASHV